MLKDLYKLGQLTLMKKYKEEQMEKHPLIDLFWECTLTCNAKCKHCGSSAEKKIYDGELNTDEIKNAFYRISKEMDAHKILINVTGGEPLLRKDLFDVMKYATGELGFHWGMTTNGMLLNDTVIQKLKSSNMETVSISIDGLEKTHDEFRGVPGSYKLIFNNIKKLIDANFLKHVQVTTVVHKRNLSELDELYKEILKLNIKSWRLASIDPIGRANENYDLLLDGEDLRKLLDFILLKKRDKKIQLMYGCPRFFGIEI